MAAAATAKTATITPIKAPTLKSQVETITPKKADQYLTANTRNRQLNANTVTAYAEDMASGRWVLNGDAIRFTQDGQLLDGQHRLAAVIEAGVSIPMLVIRDLPADAFETIDAGRRRSASDVLHLSGQKNTIALASAGRIAMLFATRGNLAAPASRAAITGFVLARPYLGALVDEIQRSGAYKIISAAPLGAVLFLANGNRLMDEQVASFIEGVASGAGLERGDPRLALREWAINERRRTRGYLHTRTAFSASARAWTAHVRGQDLRQLKVMNPTPVATNTEIAGFHFGVGLSAQIQAAE